MYGMRDRMRPAARLAVTLLLVSVICDSCLPSTRNKGLADPIPAQQPLPRQGLRAHDFPITLYHAAEDDSTEEARASTLMTGNKPLVLMFWAARSRTSARLLPRLQQVYELYQDDVAFLALDVGEYTTRDLPEEARDLLEASNVTVPAGRTSIEEVLIAYQVRTLPTIFFIDGSWRIQARRSGDIGLAELSTMTARLLDGSLRELAPGELRAGTPLRDRSKSAT